VVTVTGGAQTLLQAKLPAASRSKVILALNGIDHLAVRTPTRRAGPFRIVHTGSLYQDRDPRPFFRALAALQRKRGLTASDVRVDFIGHCHSYGGESLRGFADELGIGPLVRFTDWIPHEECQRALAKADLLLLFAQNNPNQVANKLYEYLGTRKSILAFGEADGESMQMLAMVGGHHLVTKSDSTEVERNLVAALSGPPLEVTPESESFLAEWRADRQMAHLLAHLGCDIATDAHHDQPSPLQESRVDASLP
jgi:hypothetical protein